MNTSTVIQNVEPWVVSDILDTHAVLEKNATKR